MNVKYKAIVAIQSTEFCNFISADGATRETPCKTKPWLNVQEEWEILLYSDTNSTANVKFGDIVSFKNGHFSDAYLSGFPGYVQLTTMDAMQDFERWKLVDPSNPSSTAEITTCDTFELRLVNNNEQYSAKVNGGDIQNSVPLVTSGASTFKLVQTSVSAV